MILKFMPLISEITFESVEPPNNRHVGMSNLLVLFINMSIVEKLSSISLSCRLKYRKIHFWCFEIISFIGRLLFLLGGYFLYWEAMAFIGTLFPLLGVSFIWSRSILN